MLHCTISVSVLKVGRYQNFHPVPLAHTDCTCLAADGLDLRLGVPLGELGAAALEVVEAEVRARVEGAAAEGKGGDGGGPLQEIGGNGGQ